MDRLGRYISVRKIGSGGMAEVFLARSEWAQGTEKLLVIKKIHPALSENEKFINMFVDEASVAMRLNHVNIVQVYTFEQIENDHVLAMEFVDGFDLLELETIARSAKRRFPQGLAAFIAAEAAKGLDYAHSRKDDRGLPLDIVHRDVSPQNILISREGEVKVTDFGIARARWLHEEVEGTIKGKFGYMAPEQASGRLVDRRSDVYSLGVVLYEMLAGQPFLVFHPGDDPLTILRQAEPKPPSDVNPSVSKALDDIVLKSMARSPDDRFQTAREVAVELVQYLHKEREIYDVHALQSWISSVAPVVEPIPISADDEPSDLVETAAPTRDVSRISGDETTTSYHGIGDEEQRILVVVQGKFDVSKDSSGEDVSREIIGLVNEMAFKAGGVLEQTKDSFSVFLGILHSSNEDAISGIRLSYDVLDALRAVSADRQVDIRVKLAVTQGLSRFEPGSKSAKPKFEACSPLTRKAIDLFEHTDWGSVTTDDRVFRLARREYNFEKMLMDLKATASGGVRAYRIVAAKSRLEKSLESLDNNSFYGRESELELLGGALHSAINGKASLRMVIGEMGIGKSRIVDHFVKSIPPSTVRVFSTECLFAERDKPLSSAVAVTRAILGIPEGDAGTELGDRLNPLLRDAPVYAKRQAVFFQKLLDSPDALWSGEKDRRRELIRRTAAGLSVLVSLIAKAKPALIVVENAHWLDGPSVDILSELAGLRGEIPVLVLFVGQSSTLSGRSVADLETIEVGELQTELLGKLIMERLGLSESMEALCGQIVSRVQGNPFFASEIIDSLIEQDIIVEDRDSAHPRFKQVKPGTIRLPATMEGIALSRLDALPTGQRVVLRTASAMGSNFTIAAANVMIGRDTEDDVLALVRQSILVPMNDDPGMNCAYRFCQPMMRESAYESLLPNDRKRIHRTMAAQLVEAMKQGEAVSRVRIAWHLDHAGEKEAAGKYYLDAGNAAMEFYSDREALRLYDRALRRLPDNSLDRFEALSRRERVLRDLLRNKERKRDLKEMERIADTQGDIARKAYTITRRAQIDYDLGDCLAAAGRLGRSLELAVRSSDVTQQIEALRLLAYVAVEQGHLVQGLDCCNRALVLMGERSDASSYLRARALGIKGFVLLNMGDLDAAAGPLARALVLFRRVAKRRNESQVMSNLGLLAQARGDLTEAIDFIRSAVRIDAETKDVSARGQKLAALGLIRVELGDFEKAESNFNDSVAICRGNEEHVGAIVADMGIAELLMERGEYSQSRRILEGVSRSEFLERSRLLLVRHRQLAARALVESGMPTAARRLAEEATRVALEAGMTGEAIHSGVIHGFVLAETGMIGEALLVTRRATDLLASLGRIRRGEQVWWLHASTLKKAGDDYRAGKALVLARNEVERRRSLISKTRFSDMYEKHPLTSAIMKGFDH